MYEYTGQKCAVCLKTFAEGDDIVVCPECGAPYHRACYEKAGRCLFEDRHAPGFEWKPAPSPEEQQARRPRREPTGVCPVCGAQNPADTLFCRSCGAPMHETEAQAGPAPRYQEAAPRAAREADPGAGEAAYGPAEFPVKPDEKLDGIEARYWAAYVGSNAPIYLLNFKRMEASGQKTGMSFSAMLFGPFYFFYRRVWGAALVVGALDLLLSVPSMLMLFCIAGHPLFAGLDLNLLQVLSNVATGLHAAVMVACGLFGTYLYQRQAGRKIRRLLDGCPPQVQVREQTLAAAGGPSLVALILAVGAVLALSLGCWLLLAASPSFGALLDWFGFTAAGF